MTSPVGGGGTSGLLLDVNNYLVLLLLISVLAFRDRIRPWIAVALALTCAVPFFLNDILFPANYMPDQFLYQRLVTQVRADGFDAVVGTNTGWASRMLALVPIPFVETIRSLGFANKLIYVALVVWLIRRHMLSGPVLWFVLLYPSLVLYSGLSLRDTLIMAFMLGAVLLEINRRRFFAFLLLLPLTAIKFQNGLMLLVILVLHALLPPRGSRRTMLPLLVTFGVATAGFFALSIIYLDLLNFYRVAMVVEDGGRPTDVQPITGGLDLVTSGLANALYFLVKPLPWAAENALQLVQAIENVAVAAFLGWITWQCARIDRNTTLFWAGALVFSCAVYGLVVANFGTAARYRFPFIVMYVVALAADTGFMRRGRLPANPASVGRWLPQPI